MEEGSSSESLNFAALHRLPVLFVCENNGYGASSALCCRQPNEDISARAKAYGIRSARVDGNNVVEVYKAARKAVAAVRQGQGPFFLECLTYRWYGHMIAGLWLITGFAQCPHTVNKWSTSETTYTLRRKVAAMGTSPARTRCTPYQRKPSS